MENRNITGRSTQQTSSLQQNQESKPKLPSPAALLRSVTGASKRAGGDVASQVESSVKKLSSALQSGAHMAQDLEIPELPKAQTPREILTEKAPSETPSGARFDPLADASTLMQAGRGDIFGTKEKQIRELLSDRSPEQLKAVEAVYNDRFEGRNMWNDLRNEFGRGSSDRKMVEAFERGDRVGGIAEILVGASTGAITSKTRVRETLERLSPEERQQVQERYAQLHPNGRELKDWVDDKFSSRKQQVNDLLNGDDEAAQVSDLQRSLSRNKGSEVVASLRGMNPEERREFVERFNSEAKDGGKLEDLVKGIRGTNGDQARALVAGNQAAADAALIQDAVDGLGSNKDKLWQGLGPDIQDPTERQAYMRKVETEYNRMYGPESPRGGKSLQDRIKQELGGENRDKALTMLEQGEVPPEKQLVYSLSGSRKDGLELAELVKRYGPEEARKMYAQATIDDKNPEGRSLDRDVQSRLSGRGRFEAEMAMRGKPQSPEEAVAWARERAEFESTRGKSLAGAFTITDDHMWNNVDRSEAALQDLRQARESGEAEKVAAAQARIGELTGYTEADTELYREAKDAAVETAAGVAAGVGAGVAIAVTGGAATPLVAAGYMSAAAATTAGIAAGAATGAALNYSVRSSMSGRAYDQSNTTRDLAVGAMEGFGVKGGSLLGSAVRQRVTRTVGEGAVGKTLGATVEGVSDGLVGGGLMGATETALADGTWDRGLHGLKNVAEGTRDGAVGGALVGGVVARPLEAGLGAVKGGLERVGRSTNTKAKSPQASNILPENASIDRSSAESPAAMPDLSKNPLVRLLNRLRKAPPGPESLPRNAWETDLYKATPEYKSLKLEQRRDYDAIIESLQTSQSHRRLQTGSAALKLLQSGRLLQEDKFGRTTLDHLTSIRSKARHPDLAREANEIFESSVRMVGDPGHAPHQGSRGSCTVVGLQHLHAKYAPADFLRVIDGLTGTEGRTTWASGRELMTEPSSLKTLGWSEEAGIALEQPTPKFRDDGGYRSRETYVREVQQKNRGPVSRIYQSSAMANVPELRARAKGFDDNVRAEYDNNMLTLDRFDTQNGMRYSLEVTPENRHLFSDEQLRDAETSRGGFRFRDKDTGRLMEPKDLPYLRGAQEGTFASDGNPDVVTNQLLQDIFDRKSFVYRMSPQSKAAIAQKGVANLEPGDLTNQDQRTLRRLIVSATQAQRKGRAVALSVKWGSEGHSYHSVSLVGMSEDGRFLIKNSQYDSFDPNTDKALRRSEVFAGYSKQTMNDKIFAVSPEDLLANLEGFQVSHFVPSKGKN